MCVVFVNGKYKKNSCILHILNLSIKGMGMSIEIIAAGSAVVVSIIGVIFNYYKLKDDEKTWSQSQEIELNKNVLFETLKKRRKHYGRVFELLGEVRDIDYPKEHYEILQRDREKLKENADLILKELYGEAGLFMSYETRSTLLKVYQNSYRFAEEKIKLNDLIDSYYLGRRALRKDLEFDDTKSAQSSEKIIQTIVKKSVIDESDFKWKIPHKLAYSPRPGYPNKSVDRNTLNATMRFWKKQGIRSIISLLSDEEIAQYYEEIDGKLIDFYKENGFEVYHISIDDFQKPPINAQQMQTILEHEASLSKPLLVHCGAGQDRSGYLVADLADKYDKMK